MLSGTPFHAFDARAALGQQPSAAAGYDPLVPKAPAGGNDTTQYLRLPAQFNYQVISRQGQPMTDGQPTPGIFDAIGAFRPYGDGQGTGDRTILIRNHENRRRAGEFPVVVPPPFRYDEDPSYNAGCTKLVVERKRPARIRRPTSSSTTTTWSKASPSRAAPAPTARAA